MSVADMSGWVSIPVGKFFICFDLTDDGFIILQRNLQAICKATGIPLTTLSTVARHMESQPILNHQSCRIHPCEHTGGE